jgi:hypothetical protein
VLHLLCERAAGPESFWAPYIACLGDQATHPLLWGEALQQQLAGSSMLRTLTTRLQQVQEVGGWVGGWLVLAGCLAVALTLRAGEP